MPVKLPVSGSLHQAVRGTEPGGLIKPIVLVYIIEIVNFGKLGINSNPAGRHLETKCPIAIVRNGNRVSAFVQNGGRAGFIAFVRCYGDNNRVPSFRILFAKPCLAADLRPLIHICYGILGGRVGVAGRRRVLCPLGIQSDRCSNRCCKVKLVGAFRLCIPAPEGVTIAGGRNRSGDGITRHINNNCGYLAAALRVEVYPNRYIVAAFSIADADQYREGSRLPRSKRFVFPGIGHAGVPGK